MYGLTGAVIARAPVRTSNQHRMMAHDRRPPPGYLEARKVNFRLWPPTSSGRLLPEAQFAVRLGPDCWGPFDAPSLAWVRQRFPDRDTIRVPPRRSPDVLNRSAGADVLDCGAGSDFVSYWSSSAGVTVTLADDGTAAVSGGDAAGDTLRGFENIEGSGHADVLDDSDFLFRAAGGHCRARLLGDSAARPPGGLDVPGPGLCWIRASSRLVRPVTL